MNLHKNVWILATCQALMMSSNSLVVFVGGIIGASIAPSDKLATLPVASVVVGTAIAAIPVSLLMKRFGRKSSFIGISIYTVFLMLLAAYSLQIGSFYLFCLSMLLLGFTVACIMQFRFAAMESVSSADIPKAASFVLIGGIAAAFIGPEIAVRGQNLFETPFVGSFLLLGVVFALCTFIIWIGFDQIDIKDEHQEGQARSLRTIARQPAFWVAVLGAAIGYSIMSFIMTATPVSMHIMDGHSLSDTKIVIQSHIAAMFLPSLVSAWFINKLGISKFMYLGLVMYSICLIIAFLGHEFVNYWVSLVLLGVGWNFLFVGSTALLPQTYETNERFRVQAFNDFAIFSTQAVASLSAGWLVSAIGWEQMLLLTIPLILVQVGALINWKRSTK